MGFGAQGRDRTGGLLLFRQVLLPTELPEQRLEEAEGLEPPERREAPWPFSGRPPDPAGSLPGLVSLWLGGSVCVVEGLGRAVLVHVADLAIVGPERGTVLERPVD